jgi:hypothetical protein
MSRVLKVFHLTSLGLGLLSGVALIFNIIIFSILYPQVTQLFEMDPSWETYGIVVAINIILVSFFQLVGVITLLSYLIVEKQTSLQLILALVTGILSGLMLLADIALLSDIGTQYTMSLETQGEWIILFISYGLHVVSLVLIVMTVFSNLQREKGPAERVLKDEVLFLSLHSTGVICGMLGLMGVITGLFSGFSLWIMEGLIVTLSGLILSPYLVILFIWLFRCFLGNLGPSLDEKQSQDLARAGMFSMIISLPMMVGFFGLQVSSFSQEAWSVLWMPLLIFLVLTIFSGLVLGYFRSYS